MTPHTGVNYGMTTYARNGHSLLFTIICKKNCNHFI